jgi:hypothetical protein
MVYSNGALNEQLAALEIVCVASTAEPSLRRRGPLIAGSRSRAFHFSGTERLWTLPRERRRPADRAAGGP